jgi:spermidine/putrescine transport system ATP-binding protein
MLEIRSISKTYAGVNAVDRVSLTIQEGEFFSLLGPSGCGKTTLLRMLSGIETPTSGEIHLNGQRIDNLPANKRQFNMVFQRYALFPHLNVRENIAFGLKMKKVDEKEIHARVDAALSLVQMETFAKRSISTLSGGQQQRIALARAFVNRPKVLLLDEPLSALDLKLRQQMQVELIALQRKLKHTFIFVTHDQEEALTLSDRIAVMKDGVVEQVGTAQEIYEHPKTPFVAKFIGSVNTFEGRVSETLVGELVVDVGGPRKISVKSSLDGTRKVPALSLGTLARVLIRPEKMIITKVKPDNGQNYVEGRLKEILYQGPVTQYLIDRIGDHAPILVTEPNTSISLSRSLLLEEPVFVSFASEDCIEMEKND